MLVEDAERLDGAGVLIDTVGAEGLDVICETANDFTLAETVFRSSETSFRTERSSSIFSTS
jgi:hypothetical protein